MSVPSTSRYPIIRSKYYMIRRGIMVRVENYYTDTKTDKALKILTLVVEVTEVKYPLPKYNIIRPKGVGSHDLK